MTDTVALSAPDQPRLTIGQSIFLTFGILGRNVVPLAVVGLLVNAAQAGIEYMLAGEALGHKLGIFLVQTLSHGLVAAPVTFAVFQDLRGSRLGIRDVVVPGMRHVPRVTAGAFVFGLVGAVAGLIMQGFPLPVGIAMVAAIIVAVLVLWLLLTPVLVAEDVPFFRAFDRASRLIAGRRWWVFGLLLLFGLILAAIGIVLGLLIYFADQTLPGVGHLLAIPLTAFYSVVGAILPAVVYYLLRVEKEGIGIDDIAKVFD